MATRPKANRGSASAKASRSAPARSPSPKAGPSRDEIKPRLMKAVFDTRPGSGYDDEIQTRYHFPDRYLDEARKAIGDWIVYRAPRRGGAQIGYFAAARVVNIDHDPIRPGHSYARLADFLPFDEVVPLERPSGFYERQLNFL